MFTCVYLCLRMLTHVYSCLLTFNYVHVRSLMFTSARLRLLMSTCVYLCLLTFTCVYLCLRMFTYVVLSGSLLIRFTGGQCLAVPLRYCKKSMFQHREAEIVHLAWWYVKVEALKTKKKRMEINENQWKWMRIDQERDNGTSWKPMGQQQVRLR